MEPCPATDQSHCQYFGDGTSFHLRGQCNTLSGTVCLHSVLMIVGGSGIQLCLPILASLGFFCRELRHLSVFNICYTGVLPTYDPGSYDLNIPRQSWAAGTLSLSRTSTRCEWWLLGTAGRSITI